MVHGTKAQAGPQRLRRELATNAISFRTDRCESFPGLVSRETSLTEFAAWEAPDEPMATIRKSAAWLNPGDREW